MSYEGQQQRDPSTALGRAYAMGIVVILAFSAVAVRLYVLQIQRGEEFRNQSQNNFFRFERLEHSRGEIVDRRGRVLVTNRPAANIYITPAFFPQTAQLVTRLGRAIGMGRNETKTLSKVLDQAAEEGGLPILLADGLSTRSAEALRRRQLEMDLPLDAVPMVRSQDGVAAYLDPTVFPSPARALKRLGLLLGMDEREVVTLGRRVKRTRGLARYRDILVRRDVTPEVEGPLTLEVELGELPGVSVRRASARDYRFGSLAAHTIGYVNELSQTDLNERRSQGYRLGDVIGRAGVERTFEDALRGTDGRETVVVDSKGRAQSTDLAEELQKQVGLREKPRPGHRVVLTLDLELQRAAEQSFDGQAGAVILMEVDTGALLALTSTPSYNPSLLAGYFHPKEKARLASIRKLRPWRFRAIQDTFAPGSTFKIVTALAALDGQHTHSNEQITCPGHYDLGGIRWRCWRDKKGHGKVDIINSLAWSCDTFYYTMGARIGIESLVKMGKKLGFGAPTGASLGRESSGIMPSQDWFRRHREIYTLGQAVNASIGQGKVTVTPMQLAVAYVAIANGGHVMRPRIASRIETYDGNIVEEISPEVVRTLDVDPYHLKLVQDGLRKVVNHPSGTAYRRRLASMEVSGKTGTAQVRKLGADRKKSRSMEWKYRDHAWFAAYAPSDAPEVAVVVFNEHGGSGSSAAAPIAMKILDAWRIQKEENRSLNTATQKIPSMVVGAAVVNPASGPSVTRNQP
ncbi:MAG: penicillin-binding protein 2 [Myxococcales bacterium]|nr:penicillin-binding protein 2 [Myxococcales bacterium]